MPKRDALTVTNIIQEKNLVANSGFKAENMYNIKLFQSVKRT